MIRLIVFLVFTHLCILSIAQEKPIIEWVSIPMGTFVMGSPNKESGRNDDETQHLVSLRAFKMSKYEVTFEQYDIFCEVTGRKKPSDEGWGRSKRPVINVSWEDATAFADWVGCRLPTEAEWEYACRALTTTPFCYGKLLSYSVANYDGYYISGYNHQGGKRTGKTLPVGSFEGNAFGLFDMHGNVWEWCNDWYGVYASSTQTNPQGPQNGVCRVLRGGSWYHTANLCRSANRISFSPSTKDNDIGFRLVAKIE